MLCCLCVTGAILILLSAASWLKTQAYPLHKNIWLHCSVAAYVVFCIFCFYYAHYGGNHNVSLGLVVGGIILIIVNYSVQSQIHTLLVQRNLLECLRTYWRPTCEAAAPYCVSNVSSGPISKAEKEPPFCFYLFLCWGNQQNCVDRHSVSTLFYGGPSSKAVLCCVSNFSSVISIVFYYKEC